MVHLVVSAVQRAARNFCISTKMKKIIIQKNNEKKNGGFTLIETMISVALFLIIITAGMGSLLNASAIHQKTQAIRSIMDNLSFVTEDMSRNIRTGSSYHCIREPVTPMADLGDSAPLSSPTGLNCWGIAFEPSGGGDQWGYEILSSSGSGYIVKSIDNGKNWAQLTPLEINIDGQISGFTITGAKPPADGDFQQPFVTIRLVGSITSKGTIIPFSLQTSVSQRLIDI